MKSKCIFPVCSKRAILTKFKTFFSREEGNTITLFAISILPLSILVGGAIDYRRATLAKIELQQTVDKAILTAAVGKHETNEERIAKGEESFQQSSLKKRYPFEKKLKIKDDKITATGSVSVPMAFLNLINIHEMTLNVSALARIEKYQGAALCMLALETSDSGALHIQGNSEINAKGCAIHTNSTSDDSITENGRPTVTAKHISTSGYTSVKDGDRWTPLPDMAHPDIADPFGDGRFLMSEMVNDEGLALEGGTCLDSKPIHFKKSDNGSVQPAGIHCGDWKLSANTTIKLAAGTHIFYGDVTVVSKSTIEALEGSTLIFVGGAKLDVRGQGNLNIVAPAEGILKGMTIISSPAGELPKNDKGHEITAKGDYDSVIFMLVGGGELDITGTIYLPDHEFELRGNSEVNQNSSLFSIIARRITLQGNSTLNIKIDAEAVDMDPLPCSVEGGCVEESKPAYLIR